MFVPKDHDRIVFEDGDLNGRVDDVKTNIPSKCIKYLPNVGQVVNENEKKNFRSFVFISFEIIYSVKTKKSEVTSPFIKEIEYLKNT